MSFLFLFISGFFFWLSHFVAKKTLPEIKKGQKYKQHFNGNLQEFKQKLNSYLADHPNILILESSPTKILLSEEAKGFSYGYFYHLEVNESQGKTEITWSIQPKLVSNTKGFGDLAQPFSEDLEKSDVG